eukprot:TRINITY_DN15065_c0_g1_i1.p1 TRINITY_DN15065_c0_g1~~TRINITY_DN15065_c0_g1_i1.p1  ORF type:complete len:502 (-),score=124.76 TRINITY_DN15065_c0_g1_i1:14-1519(-)
MYQFLNDKSSVTSKLAVSGFGVCFQKIGKFFQNLYPILIKQLLGCTNNYFLVNTEILSLLTKIDFSYLYFMNQSDCFDLQKICIEFIIDHLANEDSKIREAAADSLMKITKNLIFFTELSDTEINRYNCLFHRLNKVLMFGNLSEAPIKKNLVSNLSSVFGILMREISKKNSKTKIKGLYLALKSIIVCYSKPKNYVEHVFFENKVQVDKQYYSFPNPTSVFFCDIVPFTIQFLTETDMMLDLDLHIDIITMINSLVRKAGSNLKNYWVDVLIHVLKLLNMFSSIKDEKSCPSLKKKFIIGTKTKWSDNEGYFADSQNYLDLYQRLEDTYKSSKISLLPNKFNEFISVVLMLLSSLIRNVGRPIIMYSQEIIQYLGQQFFESTDRIATCVKELFVQIFRNEQSSEEEIDISSQATEKILSHQTQKPLLGFFQHFISVPLDDLCEFTSFSRKNIPENNILRQNVQYIDTHYFNNPPKLLENETTRFPSEYFLKSQIEKAISL